MDLAGAKDPCYVIYTSGSTGVPRGRSCPGGDAQPLRMCAQSIGYPQWMKSVSVTTVSFVHLCGGLPAAAFIRLRGGAVHRRSCASRRCWRR